MADRFSSARPPVSFGRTPGSRSGVRPAAAGGAGASPPFGCAAAGAGHESRAPTDDPSVAQELVETLYHVLWELVHVFLEHRGGGHDAGASSFLYPFLGESKDDLDAVVEDVRRSIL